MDRLSEIRARCERATPGPWEAQDNGYLWNGRGNVICHVADNQHYNADFIAYAREDIPYLLSLLEETWEWDMYQCAKREIDRLRGEVERLTADRWIPVEERLPENADTMVLVIVSGSPCGNITLEGAYELATYSCADGWILEEYPDWEQAHVTHWRPLPEPPKEARHV